MTTQEAGVVQRVLTKDFRGKMLYSFSLGEDKPLFGLGGVKPNFNEGDEISFEYILNNKGYPVVDGKSVKVVDRSNGTPQAAPAQARSPATSREEYWLNKEARDIETQKRISFQAARNSSIETFSKAVELGLVSLGQKKDEKFDNFLRGINKLTLQTYWEYQDSPSLARVAEEEVTQVPGTIPEEPDDDVPY